MQIKKLEEAFDTLKQDLLKKLRAAYRRQMEETVAVKKEELVSTPLAEAIRSNASVAKDVSSSFSVEPKQGKMK